jgi:hypothetical protein
MAYIGIQPAEKFTSFATQEFSTSATTSYTLDHAVANENEIALFVNNVRQQPGSGKAYTATGTALTLSAATASTDTMYCVFLGRALQTVTPATNSITAAMVGNDLISGKDALTSEPASTDELLVSDAGTLKRFDFSLITNTPAFSVRMSGNQDISTATATTVTFDTEDVDTDSAFASNTFTVPSGKGGKYFVYAMIRWNSGTDFEGIRLTIRKNSSNALSAWGRNEYYQTQIVSGILDMSATDTLDVQVRHTLGSTVALEDSDSGPVSIFSGFRLIGA